MPKYMLVIKDDDGDTHAHFYETYAEADGSRMDAEVSLGWYVEMYKRAKNEESGLEYYEFMY